MHIPTLVFQFQTELAIVLKQFQWHTQIFKCFFSYSTYHVSLKMHSLHKQIYCYKANDTTELLILQCRG